ncbi:MAG: hypothetical protein PHH84_06180 [Oscillospiraceae bacterium]|nr:hypothetical protein [Oscillospiraceae bacterium]MDD4413886.1 hypothetical protein [Oscillospiraceae bacterium]
MVSIVPADEDFLAELNITPGSSFFCLNAFDGKQSVGYVIFRLDGRQVVIISLETEDEVIADGLIRAALNSSREKGAVIAVCRIKTIYSILKKIGFNEDGSNLSAEINEVLTGKCKKHFNL